MKYLIPSGSAFDLYLDALRQPHLLIAGTTGSGKSVLVNALIYTALYKAPGDVSFILIDPKRVELSEFRPLPHTLYYASEPDTMPDALRYAMNLTERRFTIMQAEKVKKWAGGDIYVVIDELADLMTTNRKEVQPLIQRLCQIGRAARVHVIACTQTPIAKVIPTEIKVNFDARFGLRTRSKQDSRNILDAPGLELLPAYGQGVYMRPPALRTLYNIPMIPPDHVTARVRFWTEQNAPGFHFTP